MKHDMAQNHPLWRLLAISGNTQARNDDDLSDGNII